MAYFGNKMIDDDGYNDALRELLDEDLLEQPAAGIAKLVIEKGEDALSEKQRAVFRRFVVEEHLSKECSKCGVEVPYSELSFARDNDGKCSYCIHKESKDD